MNVKEWTDSVNGKVWKDRGMGPSEFDCWGLVIDFFSRVHGFDIEDVEGYINGVSTIHECFEKKSDKWKLDESGYVAVCQQEGIASHVGIKIGNSIVHAFGTPSRSGQVCVWPISKFMRLYRNNVEFFRYIND